MYDKLEDADEFTDPDDFIYCDNCGADYYAHDGIPQELRMCGCGNILCDKCVLGKDLPESYKASFDIDENGNILQCPLCTGWYRTNNYPRGGTGPEAGPIEENEYRNLEDADEFGHKPSCNWCGAPGDPFFVPCSECGKDVELIRCNGCSAVSNETLLSHMVIPVLCDECWAKLDYGPMPPEHTGLPVRPIDESEYRDLEDADEFEFEPERHQWWDDLPDTELTYSMDKPESSLPPMPDGTTRYTHRTSERVANLLLSGEDFDYSKQGYLEGTADPHSTDEQVAQNIATGKYGAFSRDSFGDVIIIIDLPGTEWRVHRNVTSAPGKVPNNRIAGVLMPDGEFRQNPNYTLSTAIDENEYQNLEDNDEFEDPRTLQFIVRVTGSDKIPRVSGYFNSLAAATRRAEMYKKWYPNDKVTIVSGPNEQVVWQESDEKPTIGWVETIGLPDLKIASVPAKIDSGARSSALHALNIDEFEEDGTHWVKFTTNDGEREYDIVAEVIEYRTVRSSNGDTENRPVIVTDIEISGNKWPIDITLTDRSKMGYPMILGRQALVGKLQIDPEESFMAESYEGLEDADEFANPHELLIDVLSVRGYFMRDHVRVIEKGGIVEIVDRHGVLEGLPDGRRFGDDIKIRRVVTDRDPNIRRLGDPPQIDWPSLRRGRIDKPQEWLFLYINESYALGCEIGNNILPDLQNWRIVGVEQVDALDEPLNESYEGLEDNDEFADPDDGRTSPCPDCPFGELAECSLCDTVCCYSIDSPSCSERGDVHTVEECESCGNFACKNCSTEQSDGTVICYDCLNDLHS